MNSGYAYPTTRARIVRNVLRTLAVNALAPYVVYMVMHAHFSSFTALVCSAVPPMLEGLWSVASRKRLDVMAMLVLGGIVLGLIMMGMGGNARLLLVRESLVTGVIGAVFLASLLRSRPLIYYLAREMVVGSDKQRLARWNERSHMSPFRRGMRLITLIWGLGLMAEALVRVYLAETMPIALFLAVSPFIQYGITCGLIGWTIGYTPRMRRRIEAAWKSLHGTAGVSGT